MRQTRILALRRETLAELSPQELSALAAGTRTDTGTLWCPTDQCTHPTPSWDRPGGCPSLPLNDCLPTGS